VNSEWSKEGPYGLNGTTRRDIDRQIAWIAARQSQLITTEQVVELGFDRSGVNKRARAGQLFAVHRGVLALHPPPYSHRQRYLAATLGAGPGSHLAGRAAAHMRRLRERAPELVEVISPSGRGRRMEGVIVHRAEVTSADRITIDGIRCTNAARTIVDLARTAPIDELEDLLLAADANRSLSRRRLETLLRERRGQPGTRRLRGLITDDPVVMRSENERRLFSICREFGVPLPLTDQRIVTDGRTFYADFLWPDLKLIVEAQSWRWHGGRSGQAADADKGQLLSAAGYTVVPFTRDQIKNQRAETGRRLLALTRPRRPRQLPGVTR
jgi:very-short-patch-repair endonuclease/predicted transcriptional regulator of viral defense system